MKNLIVNKFYEAMEEAVKKLNVFFAVDDLTEEQFVELKQLAKEKYEVKTDKVEEKPVETEPNEDKTTLDSSNKSEEIKTEVSTQ
ncbi:hypothetical protein DVV88_16490 [Clostridium botulinum]|nr:hypothetical protein [Clostridium botulinum]NFN70919.1 hypothetical protein [Clostridium botulinum]